MNKFNIFTILLIIFSILVMNPNETIAAETTIDATATTTNLSQKSKPQLVFTSDTTGYMFYRDSDGTCVYSKTTNGGSSWGTAINTTAQTDCEVSAVWYDGWTPGLTGTLIHIIFAESSSDDVYYDTLDTNGDTNGTEAILHDNKFNTFSSSDNTTITRGTDGDLYAGFCDGSRTANCTVRKCTGTCTTTGNWTAPGTAPIEAENDYLRLLPLASSNIMLLRHDVSADTIQSKTYTDSTDTWDATWTNIDTNAVENITYPETLTGAVDKTTNDIYIAYGASVAGASTADIRTAAYSSGTWALKSDVVTDVNTMIALDIAIDARSNDVYVGYLQGTAGSNTTAYYKKSLNNMTNWLSPVQINSTTGDIRYIYLNENSDERIYESYYRNTTTVDSIYGDTIADLSAIDLSWATGSADYKIYESNSLTWGAGVLACSGTLSDDNGATVNCAGGRNIKNSTDYRVELVLKNAGGTTAKMNGSSDYVDNVSVRSGWAGTSPTLGNCSFYDMSNDDYSTTCNAAWNNTNDVRITNTGSGNVNLQTGGTEGFMYLITTGSDVPSSDSNSHLNTTIDTIGEDSSKITITRQLISVSVNDGSINYGIIPTSASADTTSSGINDTQVLTNNGNVAENFNIRGSNTACWTLAGTIGNEQYKHDYCNTGSGTPDACDASPVWTALTTNYQTVASNITVSGISSFDARMNMPSQTACYGQQSADITIQAVEY